MSNKSLEHLADAETQDRIEKTYSWIDRIVAMHGQTKKKDIGGGFYDMDEDFEDYYAEHRNEYTSLQWIPIRAYFNIKKKRKLEEIKV